VEYRKEKGGQKLVSEKVKRELMKLKERAKLQNSAHIK